jgi:D-alanine transaminase
MTRIAYVNGRYVRHADAHVHVEDRGYQFADGVYEVCEVRHGLIVDLTRHLDRLGRSLSELRIDWPMHRAALIRVIREVLKRNRIKNGLFYLQVTRGVARRDHVFPAAGTRPSIVVTAKSTNPAVVAAKNANGIKAITVVDNRWDRVDIKTVGLLPNALARQQAKEAGAQEAIYVDAAGIVKEGAATNVWMVDADGTLLTRPAEHGILRGITRTTLMDVAERFSSPLRPASASRWLRSMEKQSPMGIQVACRKKFAKPFSRLRKRHLFDSNSPTDRATRDRAVGRHQR